MTIVPVNFYKITYTPIIKELAVRQIDIYVVAESKEEALSICDDYSPLFDSNVTIKIELTGFKEKL